MAPRGGGSRGSGFGTASRSGARGRGGARVRGGRGGIGSASQKQRIGGQEVSWEYDPELEVDDKPRRTYPELPQFSVAPPTTREKAQVALWRKYRKRLHEGPLYTVSGDNVRVNKPIAKKGVIINPFEDMPSYTQKYKQPLKTLPNFTTKKYCLKLFPEELWDVIEPKRSALKSKRPQSKRPSTTSSQSLHEKAQAIEETEDPGPNEEEILDPNDEDAASDVNPAEDFEDADSDMGGDYNAEQYFDGGDADEVDLDEGGEEGGFD